VWGPDLKPNSGGDSLSPNASSFRSGKDGLDEARKGSSSNGVYGPGTGEYHHSSHACAVLRPTCLDSRSLPYVSTPG
jgi:hypothetical protein